MQTRRPWHDFQHDITKEATECHCTPLSVQPDLTSVHEAVCCCLHQFLHCFGRPAGQPRWRPVCHKGSSSSSTSESGFLRFFLSHHSHHSFHHVLRFSLVCCRSRCRCGGHFFHLAHLCLLIGHRFLLRSHLNRCSLKFASRLITNCFNLDQHFSFHLLALVGHHLHDVHWWVLPYLLVSRWSLCLFQPCGGFFCAAGAVPWAVLFSQGRSQLLLLGAGPSAV